jgi:hypothetical protein
MEMAVTMTFGPVATTDDTPVTALAANDDVDFDGLLLLNKGSADGLFSIDGGVNWRQLPARSMRRVRGPIRSAAVQVKRVAGGADLANVYGEMNPGDLALLDAAPAAGVDTPAMAGITVAAAGTPEDLADSATPYRRCSLLAMKPGASAPQAPTANTGSVYVFTSDPQHSFVLTPGDSVELPPHCDLADFDVDADTNGDGLIACYTT